MWEIYHMLLMRVNGGKKIKLCKVREISCPLKLPRKHHLKLPAIKDFIINYLKKKKFKPKNFNTILN